MAGAGPQADAPPGSASGVQLVDMPLAELTRAVAQAMAAIAAVKASLPRPSRLSSEERRQTSPRMTTGECAVLELVANVAEEPAYAPLLGSLSDLDFGHDPDAFEPALLKERLQRLDALAPLADALASLLEGVSDTMIELQQLARDPLLDAYAILKGAAKADPQLKARLRDAIDFYAARASAAAKAKEAKRAAGGAG
jgi:hypothetical protein